MNNFDYVRAVDFDRAWLNFELDLPLDTGVDGSPNPFYITRPGDPIAELGDALLAPFYRPPKFFFSGHRGCGKSTELLHLMANPEIQEKYWPINFSIRDEADIIDLDFRDVLLAVGGRMFRDYRKQGGELPEQLLKDLDRWRGNLEEEITTVKAGRITGFEIGAGIEAFFANASMKMKLEPTTRTLIRQVIDRDVTGLISVINSIADAVKKKEGRIPLILIDDLDKPGLKEAKAIFQERREIMMQPNCAIVYTVSSALFYSKDFDAIRDQALFLPNVKLHMHHSPDQHAAEGYETMRKFVSLRMDTGLIESQALDEAITYSGGVFREMARIMRTAIGKARRRKSRQIQSTDVEWAAAEIRNEYRRILDKEDIAILRNIYEQNRMEYNDRIRPLLQLLALLEYRNGENWCDIHPVLRKLIYE
jgi:hypothetical protein